MFSTSTTDTSCVARRGLLVGVLLALGMGCEEGTRPVADPGDASDVINVADAAPLARLTPADGKIKIMAIGDSITHDTCWRAALWDQLNQRFAGRFDFVGTLNSTYGCAPAGFDADNQAYSSSLVTEIVAGITDTRICDPVCPTLYDLQQAFMATPTDVALIHLGTNDVWNSRSAESIVSGYTQLVNALRVAHSNIVILVAQIIPMNVTDMTCPGCTCAGCPTRIAALNDRIVGWAAEQDTAKSPIRVVDQYTSYDATADNRDGVHPNSVGSQKMADQWYEALLPLFL